ncbi:transcriptional regulator [Litorivita pollutaquae]|uniref:Transcriptional regulator n=1 Tax=Litorivita pollutaquae TaxID=2200892 RepID=A0A2V4MV83_9RHOB|nr:helix-turn-helix domain-containing protein [Litorivita pollutaquae]PYC46314.1 transcriptional regulator [Litorivita pollutaquae]
MSAFDSIKQGLEEAKAFSKGQGASAVLHEIAVPEIDISEIRAQTGLSQAEFARSIGVAKGTLLNWEHGRRTPNGPAQVLLALIARKPSVVQDLLGR